MLGGVHIQCAYYWSCLMTSCYSCNPWLPFRIDTSITWCFTIGVTLSCSQSSKKKNKSSDLKYDIGGWIILAVGIVAWIGFAKSQMLPPPPPPPR